MLDELHVHDIALIEDATIQFSPHLTVLTGETGAGKTALLDALQLIGGARADSHAVRDGSEQCVAEARFVQGEDEHVVQRRVSAQGRSRCSIDGSMATVSQLAQAARFIRIHGQHEQVELLTSAVQLEYLDASMPQLSQLLDSYHTAREAYLAAKKQLETSENASAAAARELEFARFTAGEIEKVAPEEGEYEQLEAQYKRMQHGEQLASAVRGALGALYDDGAAIDMVAQAQGALFKQMGIDDELDQLIERLDSQREQLEDLTRDFSAYAETISFDEQAFDETAQRLDALSGLMKRFGPGMEQVFATWQEARQIIAAASTSPEQIAALEKRAQEAKDTYCTCAQELQQGREQAAEGFCARLAEAVAELAMQDASFEFSFEELPFERWSDKGSHRVQLMYRPAGASHAHPLSRIASGGELSRILLALECMHFSSDTADAASPHEDVTLVFDEVDQGVGGATGAAVARSLFQLSRHVQVVVVTHLAQVAVYADVHYVVAKGAHGGIVSTGVLHVTGNKREAEIARMMAGTLDETALEHARSLIEEAEKEKL